MENGDYSSAPIRIIKSYEANFDTIRSDDIRRVHWFSNNASVAVFKINQTKGKKLDISRHTHGEEILYVLEGKTSLNGKTIEQGDIVIIPAGREHGSDNYVPDSNSEVRLLSIIIPPVREYGEETQSGEIVEV